MLLAVLILLLLLIALIALFGRRSHTRGARRVWLEADGGHNGDDLDELDDIDPSLLDQM